ncbi:MAG: fused MFS/spermidine synthase [Gammaproteobacteria bacterium]
MAILWKKQLDGTSYEVRSAGRTRRLYTDGVFHSQYNPVQPLAGGIWDLLLLPALFSAPGQVKRVLVLGVGGGTVIHQLQRYIAPEKIVGVELNPVHLHVARSFFFIDKSVAELHQADATKWLAEYRGPKFDLIIEDLFGEKNGEPVRAVFASVEWFALLNKNLARQGTLVMNFIGSNELRRCAYFTDETTEQHFKSAFQFTLPMYDNVIAAFLKQHSSSEQLRAYLRATPGLGSKTSLAKLKYHIRRI